MVRGRRGISADTDLRLARYFGLSEGYWLRLQNAYDMMEARHDAGKDIARIKPYLMGHQERSTRMTLEKEACEYFMLVSRMEYALKNSGFVKSGYGDAAQLDWNGFINYIHDKVEINLEDEDIKKLMEEPARRQIYKDDKLDWSNSQRIVETGKKELLQNCLTIRNNLFHGGKYGDRNAGNAGRNEYLLKAAKKILTAAITAATNVCPIIDGNFYLAKL